MPTTRTYGDACGVARALDVVGERWAVLIVRELLLGPQRFSDLQRALANASSNLLSDRLRELQRNGVIARHKQAPPSGSWVYELTDRGRQLEPIVIALGEWGTQFPLPPDPIPLSAASVLLYLRSAVHPGPNARPVTCRMDLDGRAWTIQSAAGRLTVRPETEPGGEDVSVSTDPATLKALLEDPGSLDERIAVGEIAVGGDRAALERLLGDCQA